MMAFVGSFTAPALSRNAFAGAKVSAAPSHVVARVSMQTKSPSVPFMDVPANLSPDMPGYVGFDPLNISDYLNVKFLQEAEIKHCRVCLLAILGMIVAEVYQFPWYKEYPHLVIDRHNWGVTNGSMLQLLIWISFWEIMTTPATIQMVNGQSDREPGYFGFDPLGLGKNPDKLATYKVNEIKNGRLAMIAVSGAIHHAAISQQNMFEQITSGGLLPSF
ncbi:unnamed protein product [Chondrus crispus]|uniref:Uncharacterized protein n=1 Tax=Chondrus crispus TaxID=2769 RepID=R7QQW5_CHOCR|nr:unnamed protein product [Chondrus crispus]CDF40148.1 unnamed protein product [Chondrus crispus]|eukprot:XP_005710442.1 unnamed protein product [Chondrus crispus]